MKKEKLIQTAYRITKEQKDKVRKLAKIKGSYDSQVIRDMIEAKKLPVVSNEDVAIRPRKS